MTDSNITTEQVESQVRQWLEQVVIGLNLCPFASKPYQDQLIRIKIADCQGENCLLSDLKSELNLLSEKPATELETTLLVVPKMFRSFEDYNQFLSDVDGLIEELGYDGVFQVASFHPNYRFGGTQADDDENLTNRAPYPILHLIREASLERALKHYPNPEMIPENNIDRVCNLTAKEKQQLFPYLFSPH